MLVLILLNVLFFLLELPVVLVCILLALCVIYKGLLK